MDKPNKSIFDVLVVLKSWIPWQSEPNNVSRDFWMPDHICRVCYECDSQFTVFNRKHHCRLCGRVFCAKCTSNSVPAPSDGSGNSREEWERIRVCNYCFKQWQQGIATVDKGANNASSDSPSPADSFSSVKSSETAFCSTATFDSLSFSTGQCEQISENTFLSPYQSAVMDLHADMLGVKGSRRSDNCAADAIAVNPTANNFGLVMNRSRDGDDYDCGVYQSNSNSMIHLQTNDNYRQFESDEVQSAYDSNNLHADGEQSDPKCLSGSAFQHSYDCQGSYTIEAIGKDEDDHDICEECDAPSSLCAAEDVDMEPVDFENNGLLWLPPEPENEEDERDVVLLDDDDDGDTIGGWGGLRTSGWFGSDEHRGRDGPFKEHKKAMKNVVDGHFRALVSQLLQVESISVDEKDVKESWLEIITSLSWEAATLLKPDMRRGGGMDPGGYVKVKCIASGLCSDSMIVKGVVCKKNVAHRRMSTRIEKPWLMILGGALEYQRLSNHLSSFDTLLQQEMDHLKMAVAKIDAHQPNILLVEKSVSRFAQEYILAKNICLVLNIKRPLLEHIARCTGAQIVPSVDHLSSQNLGYCDSFHVEKFLEEHGSASQGGKKMTKTLMYFEDCPKPLGCTILLRGANGDELKKVKHVVQYAVFAAYHLALETSFLADEGAFLPELPPKEQITAALPSKSLSIDKSITTVPSFTIPANERRLSSGDSQILNDQLLSNTALPGSLASRFDSELARSFFSPEGSSSQDDECATGFIHASCFSSKPSTDKLISDLCLDGVSSTSAADENKYVEESVNENASAANNGEPVTVDHLVEYDPEPPKAKKHEAMSKSIDISKYATFSTEIVASESASLQQDCTDDQCDQLGSLKEELPPSPLDNQSILVFLSSRCVLKGTVCERSRLLRIKYYGNFDKPLGRFLQDHLFDQSYRCRSCEMPSEAHVQCYTHRQGTLTISVKKLPEILLPGQQEGKIWMWHRCLRCPRISGFPPATRRIVMSDAAWGLSFGKFLELSFSNHEAASRVASCGHSLHRDCLRFYGSGKMVACFRYASIDVHSVYLPPPKLDFNNEIQEWIQKEADEVVDQAELLFSEVLNSLRQIEENKSGAGPINRCLRSTYSGSHITELEGVLQNEKVEFEEMLGKILNGEVEKGQPVIDILEINSLRRQLLFQSYMWDHRLVYAANSDNHLFFGHFGGSSSQSEEKTHVHNEIYGTKINSFVDRNETSYQIREDTSDLNCVKDQGNLSSCTEMDEPLESAVPILRAQSDSKFSFMTNLSDNLDAAWLGKNQPGIGISKDNGPPILGSISADSSLAAVSESSALENKFKESSGIKVSPSLSLNSKASNNVEDGISWSSMSFLNSYHSLNKNFLGSDQKLDKLGGYSPIYVSSFRELELQSGARLLLPVGVNETVIPVYDDEPTSIISYALASQDYHRQLSDEEERPKETIESAVSLSLTDSLSLRSFHSLDESLFRSFGPVDDSILSISGSNSSLVSDLPAHAKSLHVKVSFSDNDHVDKVKYTVKCYCAKQFDALRKMCCPSELDFIRSLSRCKKWGAQGGKSKVFFAKTLDDRFIIKQVTKTELESFIKFSPGYFKYLTQSISTKDPTCLAKILGIYQVTTKHLKGGKELKMDVLVMENLLFGRKVTRLYDLKGSSRSRYNPDSSGSDKVLLDQNLIEAMPTCPIFVGNKAKRLLERAVWNDTSFLASVDVMDYSLLVGVDGEKHELVLGIIDFMRQYTWDKHLETWVKASGILGGPKNVSPTVISPKQYKVRFRKAMTTYFLMVPDQWSPLTIIPSKSQSDLCEESPET
ncbi:hypothetical protein Nepgr_019402 [Nepenthes gracilis]|uniref:1-phosphatidylinositol-3-phosphate 5-kinase n=1 Tax=Nepenthes gracilis TaxID=150966 RepID=A0AAD3SV63_NEPGR|nr:hypothetical protein Nepgr_019402 [Nepenthes gracilis]